MNEADQDRRKIAEWADRFGSGRLRLALEADEPVRSLYLEERGQAELPGFDLSIDDQVRVVPLSEPDKQAIEARESVTEYLDIAGVRYGTCEIVRREIGHDRGPAIRIEGWEGSVTAIATITGPDGSVLIGEGYPDGVPSTVDSSLRPTAYGSAYGLRHPVAQEALRSAAIVSVDQLHDLGGEELEEFLPPDAHDLIDKALLGDFVDTLFLVGWKFGQPRRLLLASLAEQIAGYMLIREAEVMLEDVEYLPDEAIAQARQELDDLQLSALDEDFLYEYLPNVEGFELGEMVPPGVDSRRASLWAPLYPTRAAPSPRTTGDDEPEWTLTDTPGMSPRQSVDADRTRRREEESSDLESFRRELAELPWGLEFDRNSPYLLAARPSGDLACFRPPPAIHGAARVSPWAWIYDRYPDRAAAFDPEAEPQDHRLLDWPDFFGVFPGPSHPLAIDAVLAVIEGTLEWVRAVGGHALPAGAVTPLEQSAEALEGIVAMREQLERCRAAGLVQDDRLTRFGVRHELFGAADLRFVAEARFAAPAGRGFDEVQGDFNQVIYDFSPLPISLGIEPHEEEDGSLLVRCGMGVDSVEEAHALANEVISQILWRVGLQPIDLEGGEEIDEVGFSIVDLEHGEESPED